MQRDGNRRNMVLFVQYLFKSDIKNCLPNICKIYTSQASEEINSQNNSTTPPPPPPRKNNPVWKQRGKATLAWIRCGRASERGEIPKRFFLFSGLKSIQRARAAFILRTARHDGLSLFAAAFLSSVSLSSEKKNDARVLAAPQTRAFSPTFSLSFSWALLSWRKSPQWLLPVHHLALSLSLHRHVAKKTSKTKSCL